MVYPLAFCFGGGVAKVMAVMLSVQMAQTTLEKHPKTSRFAFLCTGSRVCAAETEKARPSKVLFPLRRIGREFMQLPCALLGASGAPR